MISVLILTYNEEQNIESCLESVHWSDDILVVDSFSTDRTVAIAREYGARVLQNKFVNFAEQRNFGLAQGDLKYDWVLHLDADEVVTASLQREMLEAVKRNTKDAYKMASKMMFQGRWLKHSGLFPWYQVRLGHKERLTFIQVGHGQRETLPKDRIGVLNEALVHYSFSKGIVDWVEKHNRYSTSEADYFHQTTADKSIQLREILSFESATRHRAMKRLFSKLPFRPLLRFFYMYFFRMGFLDGQPGLTYCMLLSTYEFFTVLKIREHALRERGIKL